LKKIAFDPNREELKKLMDEFLIKAGNNVKKLPSKQKPYETDSSPSKKLSNKGPQTKLSKVDEDPKNNLINIGLPAERIN
jgi:hypothetical protein